MIDPNTECLVSLSNAARYLPRRRAGKKPHVSCIYRWATAGCRGVILESLQVGGTRCTSKEALVRFFRRLTSGHAADVPEVRSVAQRERAAQRAMRQFEKAGV
ncbi:MAG: DUF1580 domain-containing protein [Thermoguttaceae bacterium]